MKTLDLVLRVCVKLCALFSILLLAACSNTTKPEQLPQFAIADVSVSMSEGVKANSDIAATTRLAGRRVASAYSASLPQAVPGRKLNILITGVHYKNPLASLLIGDTNTAAGIAQVSGGPSKQINYVDAGGAVINGILGAAIAIGSDRARIDAKLAAGLAEAAVASAYGQDGTPDFAKKNLANGNLRRPAATQQSTPRSRSTTKRKTGNATPPTVPTS